MKEKKKKKKKCYSPIYLHISTILFPQDMNTKTNSTTKAQALSKNKKKHTKWQVFKNRTNMTWMKDNTRQDGVQDNHMNNGIHYDSSNICC
jgi:hypothetical protein